MFGRYRLMLALLVLLKHFKTTEVFSGLAVWGFFLLSGYLITGILNTRYGGSRAGLVEFGINRALRLLPTYWASVLLAAVAIVAWGPVADARLINDSLALPVTAWEWVPAITILGGTVLGLGRLEHSLSPSAWAVDVEILMYVCSAWWIARSERASRWTLWSCAAAFPVLWLAAKWLMRDGHAELGASLTYGFLPAALLPYTLGSWLWHRRDDLPMPANRSAAMLACAALLVACGLLLARVSVTLAFLASLPVFGCMTLLLSRAKAAPAARRVDTFCGFMSYPVYLLHWIGNYAVVVAGVALDLQPLLFEPAAGGTALHTTFVGFIAVCVATLLLACLVAAAVESPIESRRHAIAQAITRRVLGGVTRRVGG